MSKYTITIQEYVEGVCMAKISEYADILNINSSLYPQLIEEFTLEDIHAAGHTLFPSTFPIYDEEQRENFMNAFIDHFYFYEIGQETIPRFKWVLRDFLNLRMPYYTQLYESKLETLKDALTNMDLTRTENINGSVHSQFQGTSTNSSTGNYTDKAMQFPLNNQDLEEVGRDVGENSDTSTGNTNDTTDTTNQSTITSKTSGIVSLNKVARTKEYRELIFSINELIFEDAIDNHLFMEIW